MLACYYMSTFCCRDRNVDFDVNYLPLASCDNHLFVSFKVSSVVVNARILPLSASLYIFI